MQSIWGNFRGPRYIDDIVFRREDGNLDGDSQGTNDRDWFHLTDVQFSTVAILDDHAKLVERVACDAEARPAITASATWMAMRHGLTGWRYP